MTDEELARLNAKSHAVSMYDSGTWLTPGESAALLAEVERLRERIHFQVDVVEQLTQVYDALAQERNALRAIVQVVAESDVYHDSLGGMLLVAGPDALRAKAHALLAAYAETPQRERSAE